MYFVKIGSLIINCDTIESVGIEEGINSANIYEYKIVVKTSSTTYYPKTFKTKRDAEEEIDWTYNKLKNIANKED
jgi:hypothetical protein